MVLVLDCQINNAASLGSLLSLDGGCSRLSGKVSGSEPRRYFTNFNNGRCSASGVGFVSAGGSSANMASHRAFSSESPIRLSLILMSRMATPTNRAVSRLPLSMRPARHSSSVISIECSLCSESVTGFLPLPSLRVSLFNQPSSSISPPAGGYDCLFFASTEPCENRPAQRPSRFAV